MHVFVIDQTSTLLKALARTCRRMPTSAAGACARRRKQSRCLPMLAGPRVTFAGLALCAAAFGCGSTPGPAQTGRGGTEATGGTVGAGGTLAAGGSLGHPQGGENSPTTRKTITLGALPDTNVDVLFVLMDWAGDPESQSKLYDQIPLFVSVLKMPTTPLDLHIAVVTADMGVSGS